MALGIYTLADNSTECSQDGAFSRPVSFSANGLYGDTIIKKLYVRNNNATKSYTSIVISLVDNGDEIVNGNDRTYGFSWKLYASDTQPIDAQWLTVANGNSISLANLTGGDISTYLPFWVKIEVPQFADVKTYQNIQFKVEANESTV